MFVLSHFFKNFNSCNLLQGTNNLELILFDVFKNKLRLEIIDCSKNSLHISSSNKNIIRQGICNYVVDSNIKDGIYYQPFGTQSFPDFLEIRTKINKSYFICLESKSARSNKSVWNCGLPIPEPNYIYIHRNSNKNLYVFTGDQIISKETIAELHEIDKKNKADANKRKHAQDIFQYYPRPMYNQTKTYDVIFNRLGINNISNIEKILKYLETFN